MSLYLCVFAATGEVAGVDAGAYSDFAEFRNAAHASEGGPWGSRFPLLMNHPDADGEWSLSEVPALRRELQQLAKVTDLDRFRDTEDNPLTAALLALCETAIREQQPILFQ